MAIENEIPVLALVLLLPLLILASKSIVIIAQDQLGIVVRLGRYHATLSPGFHLRIPLIDSVKKVDHTSDIPRWNALSPNQRVSAAQSLVLLGKVDLNFKLEMTADKVAEESNKTAERALSAIPRSQELDLLVDWLTEQASAQTGVALASDKLAAVRLTEAANKVLGSLSSTEDFEVHLPFLTANSSGPKHFKVALTRAEVDAVLKKKSLGSGLARR
jgi:hypothetical protein